MTAPTIRQTAVRMAALWAIGQGHTLSKSFADDLRARTTSTMGRKIRSEPVR